MRSSWFRRLLVLFLIVPIAELALLVLIGERIGFWPTIGLIVITALIGSWLAKREGLSVFNRLQATLAQGGLPARELIDGLIILVSGALLLTPGIITDVAGFLGLLPPSRALIRRVLQKRFQRSLKSGSVNVRVMETPRAFSSGPLPIEDAEVIEER